MAQAENRYASVIAGTGANVAYFTWDQQSDLQAWIQQNGGHVTVIAHSWGADPAAQIVSNGVHNEQLPGSGSVPAYDLRQDNRDLCLKVGTFGGFLGSATSNTVRVPREAITRALSEGIKPLPPLVPIALGWPTVK